MSEIIKTEITSNDNDNSCNGESLYRHADKAVYHSKETGRNKVTHYDDLDDSDNFQGLHPGTKPHCHG